MTIGIRPISGSEAIRFRKRVMLCSEYGITNVSGPVHINRALRQADLLKVRVEREIFGAQVELTWHVDSEQSDELGQALKDATAGAAMVELQPADTGEQ